MQDLIQFNIKKELANNPSDAIVTILKNKETETKMIGFHMKLFKMSKIPANVLE